MCSKYIVYPTPTTQYQDPLAPRPVKYQSGCNEAVCVNIQQDSDCRVDMMRISQVAIKPSVCHRAKVDQCAVVVRTPRTTSKA